jgi:SulP family sulfate permease
MIATVIVVVWSHNLALGVGIGVLLSALFFARKVAAVIRVRSTNDPSTSTRTYTVHGNVFFASSPEFVASFNLKEPIAHVIIDVTHAHFWDLTSVDALDKIVIKFRQAGAHVQVLGLNEASATLVDRLATHNQPAVLDRLLAH